MIPPVLVFTSDKYLYALRPFAYLFNKYWGEWQEVRVIGFTEPNFALPINFSFYSLGDMANYPVTRWSNAVLDYLNSHPDLEHMILMLEDYWLSRQVNVAAVSILADYARQFRNVIKIDLCADRLYAGGMTDYNVCSFLDLVKSDYSSQYHMSLMTGIWNVELLKQFIVPDETPWQVELSGTPRLAAAKDEVLVLGTRQWPVRHILALRNGDSSSLRLEGLGAHNIQSLQNAGLLGELQNV